MQPVL